LHQRDVETAALALGLVVVVKLSRFSLSNELTPTFALVAGLPEMSDPSPGSHLGGNTNSNIFTLKKPIL
jgi:hypothetical protein